MVASDAPIVFAKARFWRSYNLNNADHSAAPATVRAFRDLLWNWAGAFRPDTGVLVRNAPTQARAVETLLRALNAMPEEEETISNSVAWLLEDGFLRWDKSRKNKKDQWSLTVSHFVEGQNARTTGAVRQARSRARQQGREHAAAVLPMGQVGEMTEQTSLPLPSVPTVTSNVTRNATGTATADVTHQGNQRDREIDQRDRETQQMAERYLRHPLEVGSPREWPAVQAVLMRFNEVFHQRGHPVNDNDLRLRVIVGRLAEGSTLKDILEAIAGAAADDWLRDKPKLHTLTHIIKDSDVLQRYRRVLSTPPRPARARVVQNASSDYQGWSDAAEAEAEAEASAEPAAPRERTA